MELAMLHFKAKRDFAEAIKAIDHELGNHPRLSG